MNILKGKNKRKILVFLAVATIFLVATHLCFPSIKSIFLTKIAFAEDGGGSDGGGSDGGSSGGGSDGGSSGGGNDGGSSGGGNDGGGGGGGGTDSGGNGGGINPSPIPPTGLSASCPSPGTNATVSWNVASGATYYWLRIDKNSLSWGVPYGGTCAQANPDDICLDNVSGTSYTFVSAPGVTYGWWVHACNANGCSDAAQGPGFTCAVPSAVDIKANGSDGPINLLYKNNVTLSWMSENAAYCQASEDWFGSKSVSGSEIFQLNNVKLYRFTITCQNASRSQTATDSVQVNVLPKLPIVVTKPAIATY